MCLLQGRTRVENLLDSDDVRYMLGALTALGIDLHETRQENRVEVTGCGGVFPVAKQVSRAGPPRGVPAWGAGGVWLGEFATMEGHAKSIGSLRSFALCSLARHATTSASCFLSALLSAQSHFLKPGASLLCQTAAEGEAAPAVELFLGNAGTAMRPLTAAVAVAGGHRR